MKSLAWKLATLAAVVGIGFLVMLQAQRGMNQALLSKQGEGQPSSSGSSARLDPKSDADSPNPQDQPTPEVLSPKLAAVPTRATPTSAGPQKSNSDGGAKPPKTAELTTSASDPSGSPNVNDPFSEGNGSKAVAADKLDKKATRHDDVKQAGAFGDEIDSKPDAGSPKTPGENLPAASPPAVASPAPTPPALAVPGATATATNTATNSPKTPSDGPQIFTSDPKSSQATAGKTPPAQSGPNASGPGLGQSEPFPDLSSDPKGSSGPQLVLPGGASDTPPAPPSNSANSGSQPPPKTADKAAAAGAAPPGEAPKPPDPRADSQKTAPDPSTPFPALDDPSAPTPAGTTPSAKSASSATSPATPAEKNERKSIGTAPGASTQTGAQTPTPNLFPLDPAKEIPLVNVPQEKSAQPLPSSKTSADSKSGEAKLEKRAKAIDPVAPEGRQLGARHAGDVHAEPGPDFQGDGTIGEQAPLGPQRPQLNIEKIAPQNALIGQPLIYSIVIKNVGASEARDVVVEDRIPKGTKLSGTIPRAELTGKKLVWRLGNIAPADQRKISIRVVPLEAGEIGSVATVNFVAEAAAETVVTAPRLEFELSAPRDARLGQSVPLHFKVTNVGTGEARGVVIRNLIPEGLSHSAGNDLEYEVGRLPAGKSKELSLDLKAIKVGRTVDRAVVVAESGLTVKAEAPIEISGAKVALTRSGPSRRYLGRPALFSNTLVNESKYAVEGVVVVETVPSGMEFSVASHGGQYNDGTKTIAWRIERMEPGETRVLKSKLVPKAPGTQTSTVRVMVPSGEPSEATSETQVEGFAALGIEVAGADGPVDVGERITLRVNARNKGNVSATNVVVTVDVPEQMTIVSARGPDKHSQEGNRLRFGPIATLEGRTAATCELVLQPAKRGDSRIHVSIQADQIEKPLTREESVLVLSESK